jgi:hypothetical protein
MSKLRRRRARRRARSGESDPHDWDLDALSLGDAYGPGTTVSPGDFAGTMSTIFGREILALERDAGESVEGQSLEHLARVDASPVESCRRSGQSLFAGESVLLTSRAALRPGDLIAMWEDDCTGETVGPMDTVLDRPDATYTVEVARYVPGGAWTAVDTRAAGQASMFSEVPDLPWTGPSRLRLTLRFDEDPSAAFAASGRCGTPPMSASVAATLTASDGAEVPTWLFTDAGGCWTLTTAEAVAADGVAEYTLSVDPMSAGYGTPTCTFTPAPSTLLVATCDVPYEP